MKKGLLAIYDYFLARKKLFYGATVLLFGLLAFLASRIEIQEDITSILPQSEKLDKLNFVFKNSRFADKLIVRVGAKDTAQIPPPDSLISYADALAGRAIGLDSLVLDVKYKVSDDALLNTYNIVHNNLPLYLQDSDYIKIDSLLSREKIRSTLLADYKLLTSPGGLVLKRIIANDPAGISNIALQRLQALNTNNNFDLYEGYILSKDHHSLLLFITPTHHSNNTKANAVLVDSLDSFIAQLNGAHPGLAAEYYGGTAVALSNARQLRKDTALTLSVTITLLVLFIGFFFRKKRAPFVMLLPVAFGALLALAVIALVKGSISAIALGAGSIVLGIAINYSLHFFSHYKHTRDIRGTIADLYQPLTIGSVTTIGSFFGLLFVNSDLLHDFGLFAGCSLLGASVFTLVFLPQLFPASQQPVHEQSGAPGWMDRLLNYRSRYTWVAVLVIAGLTIFFSRYISRVGFESDMLQLSYQTEELKAAEKNINGLREANSKSVYIVTTGTSLDQALQNSLALNAETTQLKAAGQIDNAASPAGFIIPQQEQQRRIARWNSYWTIEKKQQLKAALIEEGSKLKFRETAFQQFFELLDKDYKVQPLSTFNELKTLFAQDYIIESPGQVAVITELKTPAANAQYIKEAFSKSPEWFVLDKQMLTTGFIKNIADDFNTILAITAILVLVALYISYSRIELVLMTFLPMLITWVWILGIMGLFGIKFNIVSIIISTFIFGLGDDYSIFIMDGLMNEYKAGKNTLSSHRESIILSAITTILGFGVLIFARHPALRSIAVIAMVGLFCVLIISQILIPFLFRSLILNRKYKGQPPYVWYTFLYSLFDFLYYVTGSFIATAIGYVLIYITPLSQKVRKGIFHFLLKWFMWSLVYISLYVRKRYIGRQHADFSNPSVIICNHQSFLDILVTVMQHPKVLLLTNDWVWNSPVFGKVVQLADYYPVSSGAEASVAQLAERVKEGFSIVVFPEGTRSPDSRIHRFHKGAFYLAEQLNIDIQPLLLHGIGDVMRKGDFQLMPGTMTFKYLPRIKPGDTSFGTGYAERTRLISRYFKTEYEKLRAELETPKYHYRRLVQNYIYKGPMLEWYTRVKVRIEDYYTLYHNLLPRQCTIMDIGCGYGYMDYMLYLCANNRKITGLDYEEEKIEVAKNCWLKNENINFVHADATTYDFGNYDVFILNDTLHYIAPAKQEALLQKCFERLNEGGMVLIKEGNTASGNHGWTKLTEFISTNSGFNKTAGGLHFISEEFLTGVAKKNGMSITRLDESKVTSNTFYLLKRAD